MPEKLTIRGFKSNGILLDFPLRPVNVLIGANGAGKSNLIEFFKMLRAMMGFRIAEFGDYKPSLTSFLGNKGGLSAFFFGGLQKTKEISAEAWFNQGKNAYRFSLVPTADGEHRLGKEEFFTEDSALSVRISTSGCGKSSAWEMADLVRKESDHDNI